MGLRLHDSKLRWSCCLLNFISVLFIYLARVKSTNVLKHQHITHTKHGSDKENNMYQETTCAASASCSFRTFSSVTCLPLRSQNTFLLLEDHQKKTDLWKNTHMHTHTCQNICTLCQFLQLAFCRLYKKISSDRSYKLFF